ncbi:MAG: YciI family protein [Flavobacteriaceae bacterium]
MKLIYTFAVLLFTTIGYAQQTNPNYDKALAEKYNADDYGMKPYVLVILKSGTNTDTDASTKNKAFRGHMNNINKLVADNKLIVAGPIGTNDNNYRGIFILDVATLDEAQTLLQTDPAIKAKYLEPELYNWYGSAALAAYLDDSDKIWKVNP